MLNVLIVEDEPVVAMALRDLLRMDGRCGSIDSAVDLRGALTIAESRPLDVAFVDISLANGSSGYSVASELTGQHVRCVFVTGMSPPFAMPEFAVGCLPKPFTAEAVTAALDAAVSRSKPQARAVEVSDAGFLAY